MAGRDSDVTVYLNGDISGLRTATREASREFANVGRAAAKANTDAARGSTKALAGVTRLVATGKVTVKSIDKIGRSASDAISAASGFAGGIGAALGLVALPGLSVLAVKAIDAIREANKNLATRINDAASAQRALTLGQIAARGSQEALTQLQATAITSQQKLDRARLNTNHTTEYMSKLERQAQSDHDAVTVAQIKLAESIDTSNEASKKFSGTLQKEANKALKEFTRGTVEYDSNGVNYVKTTTDMGAASASLAAALRKHAGTAKGLTQDQKMLELSLANYVETTHTVPKNIDTVVSLLGQGYTIDQIKEYLGLIDDVPPKVSTKVQTPGMNRALGDAKGLYGSLARLDGKTVTTTIITKHFNQAQSDLATGGRIGGTPNNRDNIPINVSQGEVVLNPRQQNLVDGGFTVNQALGATGAPTIRAGGGFARGGRREDRDMDTFLGVPILNRLALASSTLDEADDRSAAGVAAGRIQRILKAGKLGKRRLSGSERRMLLEALGGYLRDAQPPSTSDLGGGGGDSSPDPFALDRATAAGVAQGLGKAAAYVFGGTGDIGSGGASALGAAGSIPSLHVESLMFTNSVQNQGQIARASNVGNDVLSSARVRTLRQRATF